MPHHFAPDGARIAYDNIGTGRPLLLLHGLMAHRGFFARQHELADAFRLISIDLRGHGESRAVGDAPTIEQLAADVSGLAQSLDLQDAIGVGWSLGASVLWHVLTGPAAHRFAGSVVVDMTPRVMNDAHWRLGLSKEACEARRQAIETDFPTFATAAGQAIFAPSNADELADSVRWAGEEFAKNDAAAISTLWTSLVDQDFRSRLARIAQPTLIIHGAESHLYGADTADYVAAALPNARAISFDRSGHSPHFEQAELFNTAVRDFAASLPRVHERPNAA
ncbi:alpha/beta fold hydrolase [Allosphingosinicella sp.]|uniref:alpha/beta fold hydrolase n=1 Tax=Allosphingosinicella sp. TaxID=2823234 RepID=UPI002FC11D71